MPSAGSLPLNRSSAGEAAGVGALAARLATAQARARRARADARGWRAEASRVQASALAGRLSSRPRTHFARLVGERRGLALAALVRCDGTATGDDAWLLAAALPGTDTPMGTGTGQWGDPLQATLALSRSCDRLLSLELLRAGRRSIPWIQRVRPDLAVLPVHLSMAWTSVSMEVDHEAGTHWVRLVGELDLVSAAAVEQRLVDLAGSTVVVDLSCVSFLDARGMAALLSAKRRIARSGNDCRLLGATGIARRVFVVTGLADELDD